MNIMRYVLAAALVVAMSGSNQIFAMSSGSSSSSSSSSASSSAFAAMPSSSSSSSSSSVDAEIDTDHAASRTSSANGKDAKVAATNTEISGLDIAIAVLENQIRGFEQKMSSGRFGPADSLALQIIYKSLTELMRQRVRAGASSVALAQPEHKTAIQERNHLGNVTYDYVADRCETIWGKCTGLFIAAAILIGGVILSCYASFDDEYLAHCPHGLNRLIGPAELVVLGGLTYAFWHIAGLSADRAKRGAHKHDTDKRPDGAH